MKFTINSKVFGKLLNKVNRAVSTKTTIPVLTGILMNIDKNDLKMTGGSADIFITESIPVSTVDKNKKPVITIDGTGSFVVQARFFRNIISKMPEGNVTMELLDNHQLKISSAHVSFKINTVDANNYPRLPKLDDSDPSYEVDMSGQVLKNAIKQVGFNASNDESRPMLKGINFKTSNNQLQIAATDSHRVGIRQIQTNSDADEDSTLEANSMRVLASLIGNSKQVKVYRHQAMPAFVFDNTVLYVRKISGNYPDASQFIPKQVNLKSVINSNDLLAPLERASILTHASRNNVATLSFDYKNNQITISADAADVGKDNEVVSANLDGTMVYKDQKPTQVSFNPDYLINALEVLGDQKVEIGFISPFKPMIIAPIKQDNGKFAQIITPVRTF